jgi:hypothetical protein
MKKRKDFKKQQFQVNEDETGYGKFTCSNCSMTLNGVYYEGVELGWNIVFGKPEIIEENCKICYDCNEIID